MTVKEFRVQKVLGTLKLGMLSPTCEYICRMLEGKSAIVPENTIGHNFNEFVFYLNKEVYKIVKGSPICWADWDWYDDEKKTLVDFLTINEVIDELLELRILTNG